MKSTVKPSILYATYGNLSAGELSPNEQHKLSESLNNVKDIENAEQARMFLQLLALLREAETKSIDGLGPDAMATIIGAFAGGDEGVYAADTDLMNARFIFELVQNVDDCKYENVNDCKLNIEFHTKEDKLILAYNELGFQPENVMAITGLGNSTKNHKKARSRKAEEELDQNDLQEIGEKGIGFKSIFGLAQSVNIKSRYFNFSINRDSFFVPVVGNYDDFQYTGNTILELQLDKGMVGELYQFLKKKYNNVEAIVNENPILFLNKLTEIQYFESEKEYFGFRVSRGEENTVYSEVDTTIEFFSSDKRKNKSIEAVRFSHQIEYSVEECRARYGSQEDSMRTHKIIVIAPKKAELIKEGRIYSFFATSEIINAPFIIHAPFRLNSGRTKIDSQSQGAVSTNKWFLRTRNETIALIHAAYERLAQLQKDKIRFYIPVGALVNTGCALYSPNLNRNTILTWNIFEGIDGEFYPAKDLCLLYYKAESDDLIKIHDLLNIKKILANIPFNLITQFERFEIDVYEDIEERLLKSAILYESIAEECCAYIKDFTPEFSLNSVKPGVHRELYLTEQQLCLFSGFTKITEWINSYTFEYLSKGYGNGIRILTDHTSKEKDISDVIAFCESYGDAIDKRFVNFLNRVCYIEKEIKNTIVTSDCVVGKNRLEDFAYIYHTLDPKDRFFYPFLRIEAVSEEIDILCENGENMSDFDFLKLLAGHRMNQKNMLKGQYASILDLIDKAGTSTERFFPEILQNIDDCTYREQPHAVIRFDKVKDDYKLYVEYNEIGFTREQIRAITAIGDSTKKKLLSSTATGEKGVGFKSVFGLCNAVLIESGTVSFRLQADEPTVPKYVKEIAERPGTRMVFTLKAAFAKSVLELLEDETKLIKNCLCLKNLHSLVVNQKELIIKDTENRRKISYDKKCYEFYKYEYSFHITNQLALHQRRKNKDVLQNQKVVYLVSLDEAYQENGVYTTFPTLEEIKVPMIIDMPLQLDTARERIQDGEWNKEIIKQMIVGLGELYPRMAPMFGTSVVKYIPERGKILNHRYSESPNLLRALSTLPIFKSAFSKNYISLSEGVFSREIEYEIFNKYRNELSNDIADKLLEKDEDFFDRIEKLFENYVASRTYDDICDTINCLMTVARRKNINLMEDKEFRERLYDFLAFSRDRTSNKCSMVKKWSIIPVRFQKKTNFVSYSEDIYAPGEGNLDSAKYRILDKSVMSQETFNMIFARISERYLPIKVFSKDVIIAEFFEEIKKCLQTSNETERCYKLQKMYKVEKDLFVETYKSRKDFPIDLVRLETRAGDIRCIKECFVLDDRTSQGCLDKIIVNNEFVELAKLFNVSDLKELDHYTQLPFEVGVKELKELTNCKYLYRKTELFTSLYMSERRSVELLDGEGFFELYKLTDYKVKTRPEQLKQKVTLSNELLKRYTSEINEISLGQAPISFALDFTLAPFEREAVLSEIDAELRLRKSTEKTSRILGLISNCRYSEIGKRELCGIKTEKEIYLVFDYKINSDYDIIEVLKGYLLKVFNTEIAVNRNIHLYTRRGYERITTIVSTNEDVSAARKLLYNLDMTNTEELKDIMCRPILLNGVTFGGYAKTCPLCGAKIATELTGMRIYKTKCEDTIVPIISCSNCYENLRYASRISIDIDKMKEGILSMECLVNDYLWKVEDIVLRLGHRALINKFND